MHYLLIARFTMDDIPLRLYDAYDCAAAEAEAKAIHADPTLLDTKWKRSVEKWPLTPRGDLVGAIVLSISELDGYPAKVRFDSTTEPVPAPPEPAPPETTPPDPAHPPVPEGHIEINDPNHRLRPGIDLFVSNYSSTSSHLDFHQWKYISELDADLISNWSGIFRFCCPAEYHPSQKLAFAVLSPGGLPDGFVEITDPRHNVRVGIDYYADRSAENGVLWKLVQESSGNLCGFRFCCPADKHPALQSAVTATPLPAETDDLSYLRERNQVLNSRQIALTNDIEILRKSNAELLAENNTLVATRTQLHKTISEMLEERSQWIETHAPELQGRYDQCKERVFELESQVGFLNDRNAALVSKNEELQQQKATLTVGVDTNESAIEGLISQNAHLGRLSEDLRRRVAELEAENSIMAAKNAELYATNVAYSRKNDELRALNEDLNHRLSATKARADRATDLEGKLRGTAQHLLAHFQRLEERAKWAIRFAEDDLMPQAYAKAMWHCERKFAEEFQGFLHMYPHVLPDIPAEYWPVDDTDDEMND